MSPETTGMKMSEEAQAQTDPQPERETTDLLLQNPSLLQTPDLLAQSPRGPGRPPRETPSQRRRPSRSRTPRPRRTTRPGLDQDPSLAADFSAAAASGPSPVREALQDLSDAGREGAARKQTPSEKNWTEFLAVLAGFASMLFIWFLVAGRGISKPERRQYELDDEEADALATPAARIVARSWLNARYGKGILGSADWIIMAIVLADYAERIAPLVVVRIRQLPLPWRRSDGPRAATEPPTAPPLAPQEERDGIVARSAPNGNRADPEWSPYSHIRSSHFT